MSDSLDPALVALLIATFKVELGELTEDMTQALITLERKDASLDRAALFDRLFRNAHNIKGAARGVNAGVIEAIAHQLETLFSQIRHGKQSIDVSRINLCLESLDRMRDAMQAFEQQQAIDFDLAELLIRLSGEKPESNADTGNEDRPRADTNPPTDARHDTASQHGQGYVRIDPARLEHTAALAEDITAARIEWEDHVATITQLRDDLIERQRDLTRQLRQSQHTTSTIHDTPALLSRMDANMRQLGKAIDTLCKAMRHSTSRLGQASDSLQAEISAMRLVPLASLLRPLSRSVRDLAIQLGKKVDYQIQGDDIHLDRLILEGIKDPLMHLLRNAIDHGIETPEERVRRGKPETGRIDISIALAGSRIWLHLQDDGAGMRRTALRQAAVQKKILSQSEAEQLSDQEVLQLIFRPGFSSREMITDISGRGVGMDIVATNVRALNGSVEVHSEEGQGTRISLCLPLTLSTDRGLLVRVGKEQYAIPSTSIERVLEIDSSALIEVEASQVILQHGKPVPACELAHVLELISKPRLIGRLPVVMVSKGWERVAFLVDEIIGEREMVIKRLRPPLHAVRNVIGGTVTGSGKVIVVLDPVDLVSSAIVLAARRRIDVTPQAEHVARHILVVDDSITTRTLEKNVLENHGYQVTVAVDGERGWQALQRERFDLVLSDVEMPEMDGFQLTQRIKQSEQYRDLPVVLVTSLANEQDRRRGVEAGADAYIVKGQFETRKLLDVIQQLI